MPEWWTYTLTDFLMFSPRVYYRLIERYNTAVWPGQLPVLAVALGLALVLARPEGAWRGRAVSGALALAWAGVGWAFLWERYADINWPARWLTVMFAGEAALLGWLGWCHRIAFRPPQRVDGITGLGLYVASVALYPLLAPAAGRGWAGAELFGLMPDPTATGTVGVLMLVDERRVRLALLVAPVLWCLIGGLTLAALDAPHAWAPWAALVGLLVARSAALARWRPAR